MQTALPKAAQASKASGQILKAQLSTEIERLASRLTEIKAQASLLSSEEEKLKKELDLLLSTDTGWRVDGKFQTKSWVLTRLFTGAPGVKSILTGKSMNPQDRHRLATKLEDILNDEDQARVFTKDINISELEALLTEKTSNNKKGFLKKFKELGIEVYRNTRTSIKPIDSGQ